MIREYDENDRLIKAIYHNYCYNEKADYSIDKASVELCHNYDEHGRIVECYIPNTTFYERMDYDAGHLFTKKQKRVFNPASMYMHSSEKEYNTESNDYYFENGLIVNRLCKITSKRNSDERVIEYWYEYDDQERLTCILDSDGGKTIYGYQDNAMFVDNDRVPNANRLIVIENNPNRDLYYAHTHLWFQEDKQSVYLYDRSDVMGESEIKVEDNIVTLDTNTDKITLSFNEDLQLESEYITNSQTNRVRTWEYEENQVVQQIEKCSRHDSHRQVKNIVFENAKPKKHTSKSNSLHFIHKEEEIFEYDENLKHVTSIRNTTSSSHRVSVEETFVVIVGPLLSLIEFDHRIDPYYEYSKTGIEYKNYKTENLCLSLEY